MSTKPGSWKAMQYDELNRDHTILKGQYQTLEEHVTQQDQNYRFVWEIATQLLRAIEMYANAAGTDTNTLLTEVNTELQKLSPYPDKPTT